jgi:arsenate reductase
MKLYTYAGCDTCRKAVKWLRAQGLDVPEIPIRDQPPTKAELKAMLGHLDGDRRRLFNTSGQDYRALNLKDRLDALSDDEAFALLSERGNLVKRPFFLTATGGATGFRETEWQALIGG